MIEEKETKLQDMISSFKHQSIIVTELGDNRMERMAISILRKQGIIFIPTGKGIYTHSDHCSQDQIKSYAMTLDSSLKTQYFNTLKPVADLLHSNNKEELYISSLFKNEE